MKTLLRFAGLVCVWGCSSTPAQTPPDGSVDAIADVTATDGPLTDVATSDATDGAAGGLHVVGNTLVDQGKVVRLLGVDHAGTEYSCVGGGSDGSQGYGIFDGPSDDTLVTPMLTWKINAIRVPLNEACWLAIGKVKPAYAGANYQTAIKTYVSMIRSHGLYVILDLHWAAPGTNVGTSQQPMADADNSPNFWKSVAAAFSSDLGVVFDLFNEPYLATGNINGGTDPYVCLQSGCSAKLQAPLSGNYQTAGHQSLVDAVRSSGAKNVIMVSGLGYTSDLSGWLTHKPTDQAGNLTASLHLYNFNGCSDITCWNSRYHTLSQSIPIITGENGENDCGETFVDAYMTWADSLGISYLGWSWNVADCANFPALISSYNGTATAFGQGLMKHLQSL
jgi:endoglucanase